MVMVLIDSVGDVDHDDLISQILQENLLAKDWLRKKLDGCNVEHVD